MAVLTTAGTLVLAVFAIVTAWYARKAFIKQSKEVGDQAEMLELQRRQLEAQREDSAKQAEVLELQAADLRESLKERRREAQAHQERQAASVAAWFTPGKPLGWGDEPWGALVSNASTLPVYDIRAGFHTLDELVRGQPRVPVSCGSSTEVIRVIPPGAERYIEMPAEIRQQRTVCNDDVYAVSITFTDAAGNRWQRDPNGALRPLS